MTSGEYYLDLFTRWGASPVWLAITEDDPSSVSAEANVEAILGCDGVFLGGGEPWRLARTLRPGQTDSPVLTAIKTKLAGGFLGGTSAGMMALSDAAVISGQSVTARRTQPELFLWQAATAGRL